MKCPICDTDNKGIDARYHDKIIEFIVCKKCGHSYSHDVTEYRKIIYNLTHGGKK